MLYTHTLNAYLLISIWQQNWEKQRRGGRGKESVKEGKNLKRNEGERKGKRDGKKERQIFNIGIEQEKNAFIIST